MNNNVLVLSCNWRVGVIEALKRELGRSRGGRPSRLVVGADMSVLSAALYACDKHVLVPAYREHGALDALLAVCREYGVGSVLPSTDRDLRYLAANHKAFADNGVRLVMSPPASVRIADSKWNTHLFLSRHGLPSPMTTKDPEEAARMLPVMVKSCRGEGGKGVTLVRTKEELLAASAGRQDKVYQKLIKGREFTTDVLACTGGRASLAVPRERLAVRGGEVSKARTVRHPVIEALAVEVAGLLRAYGPLNVQCILDGRGRPHITDINLRIGSGILLSDKAGSGIFEDIAGLLNNEEPPASVRGFEENMYMLRYDEAKYFKDLELPGNGRAC